MKNALKEIFDIDHVKAQLAVVTGLGVTMPDVMDIGIKAFQFGSAAICFAYGALKLYRYWRSKSL